MVSLTLFWSSNDPPPRQNGNLNVAARSRTTGSRSTGVRPHFYPHSSTSNHTFTPWPKHTEHFHQQAALMRLTGQLSLHACCQADISLTIEPDIGTGQTLLVFAVYAPTLMLVLPPHRAILLTSSSTAAALLRLAQGQSSCGLLKSKRNHTFSPLLRH